MNTRNTYKLPSFFGFYTMQNTKQDSKKAPLQFKGVSLQELDYFYRK